MHIRFTKEHGGYQLSCTRRNGTSTQSALLPSLPQLELAHFVVESELHLDQGFFGSINEGYSIEQLSDPLVLPTLPVGWSEAKVLASTLHGLSNGTVAHSDFIATVEADNSRVPKALDDALSHDYFRPI